MDKKKRRMIMLMLLMLKRKYDVSQALKDDDAISPISIPPATSSDGEHFVLPDDVPPEQKEFFRQYVNEDTLKQLAESGAALTNRQNMELLMRDENYRTMLLHYVRQMGENRDYNNFNASAFARSPTGFTIDRNGFEVLQIMSGFSVVKITETRAKIREIFETQKRKTISEEGYEEYLGLCKKVSPEA